MRVKLIFLIALMPLLLLVSSCGGKQERPNILLITVDTLRRDHLSIFDYPRPTSPFIDKLAKEGMLFRYVVTPVPLTCGSHASILTALHPVTHGVLLNSTKLTGKVTTIAETLKKNGYYTTAAVGSTLLKGHRGFGQGFDSFSDTWKPWQPGDDETSKYQRPANDVHQDLVKQIDAYLDDPKERGKPLFIWVHYYDPHTPYYGKKNIRFEEVDKDAVVDSKFQGKINRKLSDKRILKYDEEIRFTDEHIEKLFHYLEEKDLSRNLVTALTSDHGEEFGEHGNKYSHPNFYSETTMVPLILHGRGVPRGKVIDTYISTMDIPVTLLNTAALSFAGPVEGIDLLEAYDKDALKENKKFLVVGNPKYNRSIQMMGGDKALIVNFDNHQRYWYMLGYRTPPGNDSLNESLFTSLPAGRSVRKKNTLLLKPPLCREKGLNYLILRVNVTQNIKQSINQSKGIPVKISLGHTIATTKETFPAGKNLKVVDVVYPVSIMETLSVQFWEPAGMNTNSALENPRYAIIPAARLLWPPEKNNGYVGKVVNKVFVKLKAPRKRLPGNELYDLKNDFFMSSNLIVNPKYKGLTIDYKKLIYSAHSYYLKKGKHLLKGKKTKEKLSSQEKDMLKSLGYL